MKPDKNLNEILERIFKGLIVTTDDDPVEAYAKKRITKAFRNLDRPRAPVVGPTPGRSLLARLRSEPVAELRRWRRDDLYWRRHL